MCEVESLEGSVGEKSPVSNVDPVWECEREELLAKVRRLTCIVVDRLEDGSKEGTLDSGQVRMLGSIALRSLRLWKEALGRVGDGGQALQTVRDVEARLAGKPPS